MRGQNELLLNEATMIEAVQQWLDRKMAGSAPTVTSVKHKSDNRYVDTFSVALDSDADRPGGAQSA